MEAMIQENREQEDIHGLDLIQNNIVLVLENYLSQMEQQKLLEQKDMAEASPKQ